MRVLCGAFNQNVPAMEIYGIAPCEAFFSEECGAAKQGIFTTLAKEPLATFLAWARNKRI
jgi:hypothetical protein